PPSEGSVSAWELHVIWRVHGGGPLRAQVDEGPPVRCRVRVVRREARARGGALQAHRVVSLVTVPFDEPGVRRAPPAPEHVLDLRQLGHWCARVAAEDAYLSNLKGGHRKVAQPRLQQVPHLPGHVWVRLLY